MLRYESYSGSAPKRRSKRLRCQCVGRCEPEWAPKAYLDMKHKDRCSVTLMPYGRRQGETRDKKNGPAICSPCFNRMIEVGVDVPSLHAPLEFEKEKFPIPALRKHRKKTRISIERLSQLSLVPEETLLKAEADPDKFEVRSESVSAIAGTLRVVVDRLRGLEGRGGRPPGLRLPNLRTVRKNKGVSTAELAERVAGSGLSPDAIRRIEVERRGASPEQVTALAKALKVKEKDLQAERPVNA